VDAIEAAAGDADVVVMAAGETSGVERILFGSLVDSVAAKVRKTLIVVYNAGKERKARHTLANLDAMCAIIDRSSPPRNNR
jgi:CO dehydrogenase nickel-insertion accessory protein CooC1